MKKSLIALAVLAAAGAASAQSSVTLFGVVDAAWAHGSTSGGTSRNQLVQGAYNSSRLGFRGTEDLGGGMSASFWLEAGVNNDDGSGQATNANNQNVGAFNAVSGANAPVRAGSQGLTFNRRSTVSLAGGWGELRLGRDYTPQFWNLTIFDPFGTVGAGTTQTLLSNIGANGPTAVRASNSVGYFLPGKLGGFYGQVQYYMGENASNAVNVVCTAPGVPVGCGVGTKKDGTGLGMRVGFATGPFNVAFATSKTRYAAGDVKQTNLGGQWDFGMAKLQAHIVRDKAGAIDGRGWLVGGLVPVGAGEIRLAYSTYKADLGLGPDPRSRKLAVGYVHNLSKRTAVYATYARVRNSDGAAQFLNGSTGLANASSSGYDLGIRHSF